MVDESGYTRQTSPRAGAGMPRVSAADYGAGLADQVQRSAEQLDRQNLRGYQIERQMTADREASDFAHRFALQRQNMDGIVQQLRTNPTAPDYREHVAQAMQAFDAAREGMLDGITETSVLRQAERQLDGFATSLHGSESDFAVGQQVAKVLRDNADIVRLGANRIRTSGDPAVYGEELKAAYAHIAGLSGLTPTQRDDLGRDVDQQYTVAFVNRLNDTNPKMALAQLDAGVFNETLTPQQVDQLRNGSMVEIRRVDAEAQHAANLEKAAAREEIQTATELSSQGIDVSAQLPDLIAKASAMGDTSTVAKLQGLGRDSAFAKVWGAVSPLQRQARLQALQAIPEAKRTENDQAELKWLVDKSGGLDGQFNSDPVGFAARTAPQGMGPPPLSDFSPAELAQREKWMRGAQGAYGSMQPLSAAEAGALQERAAASDVGYREVLATLGGGLSGRTAMQAVRQVLPSDAFAQSVVALAPNVQRQALDGRNERKAFPQVLKPRLGSDGKPDEDVVRDLSGLRAGFARALGNIPSAQRNGILEVAEAIAANALVKNGQTGDQLDGAMFARSLDAALGATGSGPTKKGGIGWWGSTMYLLPSGVSQGGFDAHISQFLRDHPDMAPVNPDGSPANVRAARPLAIGGNRYQFMVGNRVLVGKDGKPWIRTVTAK